MRRVALYPCFCICSRLTIFTNLAFGSHLWGLSEWLGERLRGWRRGEGRERHRVWVDRVLSLSSLISSPSYLRQQSVCFAHSRRIAVCSLAKLSAVLKSEDEGMKAGERTDQTKAPRTRLPSTSPLPTLILLPTVHLPHLFTLRFRPPLLFLYHHPYTSLHFDATRNRCGFDARGLGFNLRLSMSAPFPAPPSTPPPPTQSQLTYASMLAQPTSSSSLAQSIPSSSSYALGAEGVDEQQEGSKPTPFNTMAVSPPTPAPSPRPSEAQVAQMSFGFYSSSEGRNGKSRKRERQKRTRAMEQGLPTWLPTSSRLPQAFLSLKGAHIVLEN